MSAARSVCLTLCFTCVAVGIASVLIPQKRTRRIMSFVTGLFFISTLVTAVSAQSQSLSISFPEPDQIELPTVNEEAYQQTVIQMTADRLVQALDEILQNEGIRAADIRLTLKTSDQGRISVERAVIYINQDSLAQTAQIKSIIYRNIEKEPEIYVLGEASHEMAE